MKRILLALLLLPLGCFASVCLPASPSAIRIGVTFNADGTPAGAWAYWWCGLVNGKPTLEWRATPAAFMTQSLISKLTSYANGTSPDFINTPPDNDGTGPAYDPMWRDVVKAVATDPGRPIAPAAPASSPATAPVWRTPKTGTFTLYTVANGKLTGVVSGRKAPASALCNSTVPVVKIGTGSFYPLVGASASEVTLCQISP